MTQLFYDVEIFLKFVKDCRDIGIDVPIIPGDPLALHLAVQPFARCFLTKALAWELGVTRPTLRPVLLCSFPLCPCKGLSSGFLHSPLVPQLEARQPMGSHLPSTLAGVA